LSYLSIGSLLFNVKFRAEFGWVLQLLLLGPARRRTVWWIVIVPNFKTLVDAEIEGV